MPTNFELNRLKPKLDIVEKPENRVHKLTDSNGARVNVRGAIAKANSSPFDLPKRAYGQCSTVQQQCTYVINVDRDYQN